MTTDTTLDVRCPTPHCGRLLVRWLDGAGTFEAFCPKCKARHVLTVPIGNAPLKSLADMDFSHP